MGGILHLLPKSVLKNGWDLMPKDTLKEQVKEHSPFYIQDSSSMYVSIHDIKPSPYSKGSQTYKFIA